jgi:hypothetical protein
VEYSKQAPDGIELRPRPWVIAEEQWLPLADRPSKKRQRSDHQDETPIIEEKQAKVTTDSTSLMTPPPEPVPLLASITAPLLTLPLPLASRGSPMTPDWIVGSTCSCHGKGVSSNHGDVIRPEVREFVAKFIVSAPGARIQVSRLLDLFTKQYPSIGKYAARAELSRRFCRIVADGTHYAHIKCLIE